jgi:hypothetical protein
LGDASQPVRFQPADGWDSTPRLNNNASATVVEDNEGPRTLIKVGSGTVALGNVEYTDVAGTALPAPDTRFSWQIGRGASGNTGANSYFDGALRETGNSIAKSLSKRFDQFGRSSFGAACSSPITAARNIPQRTGALNGIRFPDLPT